ncbi:MAG: STAS/SEC14 domain-containing protein [Desulfofustis sp.]|nr:STAS/SEC14 domain-containing protein [Desulfofustis sp.]
MAGNDKARLRESSGLFKPPIKTALEQLLIKELPGSKGNLLALEITGRISSEQEKALIGKANRIVQEYGKIRVLAMLDEGARWGVKAGIEDLKWCMAHMKNIEKLAIVSSSSVWKWLVTIDGFFAGIIGIGEKHFQPSDIEDAWKWIKG